MTETYLTVKEAAEFLRVKESTIYAWVHQRRIPYRKHGHKLVFLKTDLIEWSQAQSVETLVGAI